jgi:hypothetical protein
VTTVEGVRRTVALLDVGFPLKAFNLRVQVDEKRQRDLDDPLAWRGGGLVAMMCTVVLPHRDTGLEGTIFKPFQIPLPCEQHVVLELCRKAMLGMLAHELDESLHVEGRRVWDPHK